MVQKAAVIFGVVFILIGILGFFPAFAPEDHLFGIFEVGGVHNWVHILSGLAALALSTAYTSAKSYFKVFGVIYGLVTLLGIFYGEQAILGIMSHNIADIFLHAAITAGALYLGFAAEKESASRTVAHTH